MKVLLLLILLLTAVIARENPFEPLYDVPKVEEDIIPLLNIKTNQAFKKEDNISKVVENNMSTVPTEPVVAVKKTPTPKKVTKKKVKKKKKLAKYKTIYQNYFLKVQHRYKSFKIYTGDTLTKQTRFAHPNRVAFDFKRLQYFHTKNIALKNSTIKRVKFGTHHKFYRMTVELSKYKRYKITKKPYGYLLNFY